MLWVSEVEESYDSTLWSRQRPSHDHKAVWAFAGGMVANRFQSLSLSAHLLCFIEIHWDMIDWMQHLKISEVSECGCVTFRPWQAVQHGAKENEKATFHVPYLMGWMIIQLWSKRGYTSSSSARTFARGQSQSVTTTPWGLPGGNAMFLEVCLMMLDGFLRQCK